MVPLLLWRLPGLLLLQRLFYLLHLLLRGRFACAPPPAAEEASCCFVCCLSSCCSCFLGVVCLSSSCYCRCSYYWRGCCFVCWLSSSCSCCLDEVCLGSSFGCCRRSCCVVLLICYCCCCWAFSCWHWAAAPPSDIISLLPGVASGLGCLVMGGIMILSFGHWILWTRASRGVLLYAAWDQRMTVGSRHTHQSPFVLLHWRINTSSWPRHEPVLSWYL
jgi:hypothetical protein